MKWFRRLAKVLVAVIVLIVVALIGGYFWLRTSLPDYDGTVALAGLDTEVEIIRDQAAIPHIFAETAADGYFALGYAHAQDRLWQMEMNRRTGQGRVAEIAGRAGLGIDKLVRTLGFYRLAEEIVGGLDADTIATLEAYAAGVNAYLDNHGGALPIEFLITGVDPEPWRPADSVVWGKVMTLQLSGNWLDERTRLRMSRRLSPQQIDDLWPDNSGDGPTTLASLGTLHRDVAGLAGDRPPPAMLQTKGLSNEWVVDGRRTASGKPLLANDPHLGYTAPNLWYLARIVTPEFELVGATVPGVPIVLLGRNNRIAWGLTTTEGDVSDLYVERLVSGTNDQYETPVGPALFDTRDEVIKVRGGDDVSLTIRSTRHGPVVSDLWLRDDLPIAKQNVLALKAAFLRGDDMTAQAMLRLNRAGSWSHFRDALQEYQAPQQNFAYADIDGNIGFITPGLVPIRAKGDGWVPVPGWSNDYEWTGYIPFRNLPQTFNPPTGQIVNANNKVVPANYPYFVSRDWADPYRAIRIDEMLDEQGKYDRDMFVDMQGDNLSGAARELLPVLLAVPATSDQSKAVRAILADWDYVMDTESAAPLIFTAWLRELDRALFADELGDLFKQYWALHPKVVLNVLQRRQVWCDDIETAETETCESRVRRALAWAVDDLSFRYGLDPDDWRWGEAHPAVFENQLLSFVPILRAFANLETEVGGGTFTVDRNAVDVSNREAPYAAVHGGGYRVVYDLDDLSKSLFIQATGQSGNILSPEYSSLLDRWRDFDYVHDCRRSRGGLRLRHRHVDPRARGHKTDMAGLGYDCAVPCEMATTVAHETASEGSSDDMNATAPAVYDNVLDMIGNTPMVEFSHLDTGPCRLFAKLESQNPGGSIKDRIGLYMIEAAERDGRIQPGGTLVEATAGNTGPRSGPGRGTEGLPPGHRRSRQDEPGKRSSTSRRWARRSS